MVEVYLPSASRKPADEMVIGCRGSRGFVQTLIDFARSSSDVYFVV